MSEKRRQYTQEFKDSAVKLVTEQGYQLSEASRRLGVNLSVLRRWKNAAGTENGNAMHRFQRKRICKRSWFG